MNSTVRTIDELRGWGRGNLPELIGFELVGAEPGRLVARMPVRRDLLAPNGYLHAAAVIGLADTSCGYGTMFDLPDSAGSFTTIELKTNFIGTCIEGVLRCEAVRVHTGRTTQVWDATVQVESTGKSIALFRCTQILLNRQS